MPSFRADLQGLRAVAILLVLAYHARVPGFAGGYIGVDVFFVISGYLITALLVNELETTGSIDFIKFYARRARRLLPAAAVMMVATVALGSVLYAPVEQDHLANTTLATVAYASNLYFARAFTDYLASPSHNNPLLHTWSLSVEEQFYLLWPLLIWLLAGAHTKPRRSIRYRWIVGGMLALACASWAGSVYLTGTIQPWAFFLSPMRAWEFAIGGLSILSAPRRDGAIANQSKHPVWSAEGLGWVGLAGVIGAGVAFGPQTVFPGVAVLLPTISTALILRAGAMAPERGVARLLGITFLREIGRLSYSWYLWHWPLLVFAAALKDPLTLVDRVSVVLIALVLAEASYRWVEQPALANKTDRPRLALAMAAVVAVSGVSAALTWKVLSAKWAERPSQVAFTRMKTDYPEIYRMDCDDYFHSPTPKECTFGPADASRTAVLFGDSHAGHWFPAVRQIFERESGWRLIVITKAGCPIVDATYFSQDLGRAFTECRQWVQSSLVRIHEMRPDLILVSYARTYPFSRTDWQTGIAVTVKSLSGSSPSVIMLRDVPELGFDGPHCLARLDWRPTLFGRWTACTTDPIDERVDETYQIQRQLSTLYSNVTTLDMNRDVCPSGTCRVVQNGIVSYRDASHLSTAFAASLSDKLGARIAATVDLSPPPVN